MLSRKAIIFTFSLFTLLTVSCTNQSTENEPSSDACTRYTFSQEKVIDFNVASGGFQVIYDYSIPIDTMFTYSGAFLYGSDSIIYTRVRKGKPEFEFETEYDPDFYLGELTDLVMYNGNSFIPLTPPNFDPYFSAFCVDKNVLFYWGFSNDGNLCACRYELDTKSFKTIKLTGTPGTDFFGYVNPPRIDNKGKVVFQLENGEKWTIDHNFNTPSSPKKKPTYISPNN